MADKRITDKQRIFIAAYVACRNGSQAARIAGYATPGQDAYDLLNKPAYAHVQEAVQAEIGEVVAGLKRWRNKIIDRALQLYFFNVATILPANGERLTLDDIRKADPETQACIGGITVKEYDAGSSVTIKVNSPAPYLKFLGQVSGLTSGEVEDRTRSESEIDEDLEGRFSQLADECFPEDAAPPQTDEA